MSNETTDIRSKRILSELKGKYPDAGVFDLDGNGTHFVCEIEPTKDHPEYDKAVEVIIKSKPHKHLKTKQRYTVLRGAMILHVSDESHILNEKEVFIVEPGLEHWAESDNECWVELYSQPGWTAEDHIPIIKN